VQTPHLDRFAKDAIVFENAYTHVPLTLPAHVSILTGLLPFEHGVRDNLGYRFEAKSHPTLQGLLKSQGYATGAAVSAYVLRAGTGIGDGFDFYDDKMVVPFGTDALGRVQRPGGETAAIASRWLEGVKGQPFFLFFHTYEPHAPYEPPEPFKSRYALAYDAERTRAYFARELAECAAWYALVAEAPGVDDIRRIRFRAVSTSLLSTSADIATEPWALTQMDVAKSTIWSEMRGSWDNYSTVDRKYGQVCRDVATDPAARRKYWLDKHD